MRAAGARMRQGGQVFEMEGGAAAADEGGDRGPALLRMIFTTVLWF
jgi:hypothetical protein